MNQDELNNLSYELYKLMTYIHDRLFDPKEFAKSSAFPFSYIKVLFYLFKSGSSSISRVASDLGISRSNMTPIVDSLLEEQLILRYTDKDDRRIHRIELSSDGLSFIESEEIRASKSISNKLLSLDPSDLESLKDHICGAKNILSKAEEKKP